LRVAEKSQRLEDVDELIKTCGRLLSETELSRKNDETLKHGRKSKQSTSKVKINRKRTKAMCSPDHDLDDLIPDKVCKKMRSILLSLLNLFYLVFGYWRYI
jgi:hypothetical protein